MLALVPNVRRLCPPTSNKLTWLLKKAYESHVRVPELVLVSARYSVEDLIRTVRIGGHVLAADAALEDTEIRLVHVVVDVEVTALAARTHRYCRR